ncbi:13915_t:CDS:2, partial [Acaulospora colombiana]
AWIAVNSQFLGKRQLVQWLVYLKELGNSFGTTIRRDSVPVEDAVLPLRDVCGLSPRMHTLEHRTSAKKPEISLRIRLRHVPVGISESFKALRTTFLDIRRTMRRRGRDLCVSSWLVNHQFVTPPKGWGVCTDYVPTPADYGLPYEDLTLDTSDGIKIKCYLMVQRRALPGETAKEGADVDTAEEDRKFDSMLASAPPSSCSTEMERVLSCSFTALIRYSLDFRYGQSEGSPSEQGFMIDSQAALDY